MLWNWFLAFIWSEPLFCTHCFICRNEYAMHNLRPSFVLLNFNYAHFGFVISLIIAAHKFPWYAFDRKTENVTSFSSGIFQINFCYQSFQSLHMVPIINVCFLSKIKFIIKTFIIELILWSAHRRQFAIIIIICFNFRLFNLLILLFIVYAIQMANVIFCAEILFVQAVVRSLDIKAKSENDQCDEICRWSELCVCIWPEWA